MTDHPKTSGWPERTWRNLYGVDVARGIVPNARPYVLYGELVTSGPVTEHPVWEKGMPSTFTVPNSIQLTLVASNASDYGKQVRVMYLDANLVERSEVVTLGASVVMQAADVRAIDTMYSLSGSLVGSVAALSSGVTYALIPAGSIKFDTAIRRVPAGKRLMVHSMYAGATSGTSDSKVGVDLVTTFFNGDSFAAQGHLITYAAVGLQNTTVTLSMPYPLAIPAGEWVGFVATCDKGADITAGLFGWLEDV